jgi:hypothetical protein
MGDVKACGGARPAGCVERMCAHLHTGPRTVRRHDGLRHAVLLCRMCLMVRFCRHIRQCPPPPLGMAMPHCGTAATIMPVRLASSACALRRSSVTTFARACVRYQKAYHDTCRLCDLHKSNAVPTACNHSIRCGTMHHLGIDAGLQQLY